MVISLQKAFDDLTAALIENRKISHTMVVVTAASVLENDLRECLKRLCRPMSNKIEKRLFEGYGPLGSFSAKIDLSFALSIIDQDTSTELHKIRALRNDFAHSKTRLTFEEEPILSQFMNLKRTTGGPGISHAEVFLTCVKSINGRLVEYMERMDTVGALEKRQEKPAPFDTGG
jgi:DNA-binding MltR family transcriptional regulator